MITLDPGFKNTGSCQSAITFIDGEQGILRYRGYPIEELAEKSNFLEVAYLLINGELPTTAQYEKWTKDIRYHTMLHEDLKRFFSRVPEGRAPDGGRGGGGRGALDVLSRTISIRSTRTRSRSRSTG